MVLESVQIDRIIDGDTIRLIINNRIISTRARWINCPSISSEWGIKSKMLLEGLIASGEFYIEQYGFDRYGRIFADWFIDDRNTNIQVLLLQHGLAVDNLPKIRFNLSKREIVLFCNLLHAQ